MLYRGETQKTSHCCTGMAKTLTSYEQLEEEDYIDMDLNSSSSFMCYSISASPPHPKEFEFHMSSIPPDTEANTISPADELFYKGNLLPLHLPPRLKMVAKLLHNSQHPGNASEETTTKADSGSDDNELNADDHLFHCSAAILRSNQKKSWSKKIKSIKQSPLGLKLKASRDYLKSIFFTAKLSGCTSGPQTIAKEFAGGKAAVRRYLQLEDTCIAAAATSSSLLSSIEREKLMEDDAAHRKSFSGAINWTCSTGRVPSSSSRSSSCSSSASSSFSFARSYGGAASQLQAMLKRTSNVNSEVDNSIQGAIAYCKRSQQMSCGRRSLSETRSFALSAHQIAAAAAAACENQDRSIAGVR